MGIRGWIGSVVLVALLASVAGVASLTPAAGAAASPPADAPPATPSAQTASAAGTTITPAERARAGAGGLHVAAPRPPTTAPPTTAPPTGTPATTPTSNPATTLSIAQSNCAPDVSTAGGIQAAFNVRGPVWGGGDGAQPVPIDNGRTLWLFGDTYIGGGPYGGPLTTSGLAHNSMVVQYNGNCFAYLLGDDQANYAWTSAIPGPLATDWYWPDDGTYDASTGILSIVATHVRVTTGGQWGWAVLGVDVLHYAIEPTFTLLNAETLFSYSTSDVAQFGQSIMVNGGVTYLYGCAQSGTPACYLARTDLELDPNTIQYHTATGWSSSMAAAAPLGIGSLSGLELHVMQTSDGFLATNQLSVLSSDTNAWWSASLTGPFVSVGTLFDENQPPLGPIPSNWFVYGGRLIRTSAGIIGVYSVNTWDDEAAEVAGVYGPRFVALAPHPTIDRTPFGGVNVPVTKPGAAEIWGWSIDPDTTAPIDVTITVDGGTATQTLAAVSRPDVAAVYPAYGPDHGFDVTLGLPPGAHQVCAYGDNVIGGQGNTPLGCVIASGSGPAAAFHATSPVRVLDSRAGTGGYTTPWAPGQTRSLRLAGVAGVPVDATAVVVNLTATDATASTYVTATPAGGVVPTASNLNVGTGQTVANLVTVQLGAGGAIDLFNLHGQIDLVADVVGWYATGPGDGFTPLSPVRLLDSRVGTGGYNTPWGQDQTRSLAVAGVGGVPADATAVVLNLTVTNPTTSSYVTAWPAGSSLPTASNLNFVAGQTVANLVTVQVGAGGAIDLFNLFGHTDLIADVVGYYTPASGDPFVALAPTRLLDSRVGTGGYNTPWGQGQTRGLGIDGIGPVPPNATAVVLNLTVTNPTTSSYVTAWPAGSSLPTASNLNFVAGQTVANLVTVRIGAGGAIDLFNLFGHTDLIADVVGYYLPPGS